MRFLLIIIVCFSLNLHAQISKRAPLRIYEKDDLVIKSYDFKGLEEFLSKDSDTIYVVNFWATWCAPCVAELPAFERLNDDRTDNIKVLLISLDMSKQVESTLLPFIKRKKMKSEIIHLNDPDADAWIGKVDKSWSGALPATLIYNRKDRIFYEKGFTFQSLQDELKQFIK